MKLEDTGIYANTSELMKAVYTAIFAFPKKDRVVMGDMLMSAVTDMLSDFAMSYRLPRERLAYADRFLARFESFKGLVRVSKELKRLNAKDHMAIMVLMMRIDEGDAGKGTEVHGNGPCGPREPHRMECREFVLRAQGKIRIQGAALQEIRECRRVR